jgi:hypothetical protein
MRSLAMLQGISFGKRRLTHIAMAPAPTAMQTMNVVIVTSVTYGS